MALIIENKLDLEIYLGALAPTIEITISRLLGIKTTITNVGVHFGHSDILLFPFSETQYQDKLISLLES